MKNKSQILILMCWIVALASALGSLFFSEVMRFSPCVLCWYQRIAMYPLVLIFLVGGFQTARSTFAFSLPLVVSGWVIAFYHNLLHYKIVPESASPCLEGVSCSTVYINWFGFLTIPMLSLIAFTTLIVLLTLLRKGIENEK